MSEFGIGRVPADVDAGRESLAAVEAERLAPTPKSAVGRRLARCRRCGETGYVGSSPFTTYGSATICDDCGGA